MPIAAAAISSSRMATQARPSRESRRRKQAKIVTTSRPSAVQKYMFCPLGSLRKSTGRTPPVMRCSVWPKPGASIGVMPFGPFVRLKPLRSAPLRATWGRISPKPSVTIAR